MSSINTNAGAMTALQTLKATNKNLEVTQGRISTGYAVSEASHNAAYWSIATTMRSDNNAMSTVKDALGLGAAQVDIAYTAMDAVKDTLDTMKKKLVAAQQPDIDKAAIQKEISQLQNDLKTYAKSATFSGGNWLDVDGSSEQKVVASFIRNDNGVSLETIVVDTAKTALFNSKTGETGLLEKGDAITDIGGLADVAEAAGDGTDAAEIDIFNHDFTDPLEFEEGATLRFDLVVNGESTTITLTSEQLGTSIASAADLATIVGSAINAAGLGSLVTAAANTGGDGVTLTHANNTADDTLEVANVASSDNGNFFSATELDITSATDAQLKEYMQGIDSMFSAVTTAASELGAIKTRISSQQDFVGKIMDAVSRGVGQLVDADMEEESTRLQALQVQQQLGIQALSIANGNSQNILSLFR